MEHKELQDILERILPLIFKYGVKSMTMDDIASNLGISKKTLYQHFENKADLIEKVMLSHINEDQAFCHGIMEKEGNAIEQLILVYDFSLKAVSNMNNTLVFELRKYYGTVWEHFEAHKRNFILNVHLDNIKLGQSQGLFREDLNPQIISRIHTNRIDMIMDGDVFPVTEFSIKEVIRELMLYHIRGIATQKGLEYLSTKQISLN